MARPRLGSEKKTHRIGVFFNDEEYIKICDNAKYTGLEPADFLRQIGLGEQVKGQVIVPEINKESAKNLNEIVNLLHKFMRLVQAGRSSQIPKDLFDLLMNELKTTRETILGRWQ